jgi:drug/metabolite transporter (DMT)-like permease
MGPAHRLNGNPPPPDASAGGPPWLSAAGITLGAALGLAIALVSLHAAGRVDPYWAACLVDVGTLVPAGLAALAAWRRGQLRRLPGLRRLSAFLLPASGGVGGDLAFAAASQHGALSVVSGISSMYPLVTMGLGVLLQGRRAQTREALGLGLAVAGAVLLGAAAG